MTTVAFDGLTMAADKQCTIGTRKVRMKSKLRVLRDGTLVGGCGDPVMFGQFCDWLAGEDDLPDWDEDNEMGDRVVDRLEVMVVHPDGKIFLYDGRGHPVEMEEKVYAIGSGSDLALALMEKGGMTAQQAIEYAQSRDSGTGMGVDVITFPAPKKRRKRA